MQSFFRPGKEEFAAVPSELLYFAIMEHCPGSKFAIKIRKQGNAHAYVGDVLLTDSHNSLVQATSRLVTLIGVCDLVVIEAADAVMVSDITRSQDVKHIVAALQKRGREENTLQRKVLRPWG